MELRMSDTIITNWFLVNFDNGCEIVGRVLWGIVVEDKKSRWRPGDYVCTSKVIEKTDLDLYQTVNSQYQCIGEGREVTLPLEALLELRKGYSPEEYVAMEQLKRQGFSKEQC
jgi:hypothetical protein